MREVFADSRRAVCIVRHDPSDAALVRQLDIFIKDQPYALIGCRSVVVRRVGVAIEHTKWKKKVIERDEMKND